MKTFKFWSAALAAAVAFSLASCDDDDKVFDSSHLGGTWEQIPDAGLQDAGTVRYTFRPESTTEGELEIFSSDVFAGDTTIYRRYIVGYTGHIQIWPGPRTQPFLPDGHEYDIARLTAKQMVWNHTDSREIYARFRKIND